MKTGSYQIVAESTTEITENILIRELLDQKKSLTEIETVPNIYSGNSIPDC